MLLEISLALMVILFGASCYVVWNLNGKVELMEGWIVNFTNRIIETNKTIQEIDYKGYFEDDDEVGQIFNQLKNTISELTKFEGEE
tara:strand:- start:840 stop:1097 length:258 start_codon:yes stop_codon:yes gene_type:complete